MKRLVKRVFSTFGLGVYRLTPEQNGHRQQPRKCLVASPLHHNSKEGLEEFYSDAQTAESYLDFEFYDRITEFLQQHGVTYLGKHIADIGCGTGRLLMAVRAKDPASLTGFEYSEHALKAARANLPSAQFESFDIYQRNERQFDIVFCIEVLEHLLHPQKALRNVVQMIATSGTALLTVPNGRTDTFEGHINFWSPESWELFVKETCEGFEVNTGELPTDGCNFAIVKRVEPAP